MNSVYHEENLIWIDLEMTGLDTVNDHIIEIATIITDKSLNVLAEGPVLAIHQADDILDQMDDWNTRQHGGSGLTKRVQASQTSTAVAEQQTLAFIRKYVPENTSPMCGNSICQDRRFMARLMPELEAYFHYRNLDVSTLKELTQRWQPDILEQFQKSNTHLALDDIRESIAEMQFYRQQVLKI